jgi:imidazoleglycerol-phosphate dehydratase
MAAFILTNVTCLDLSKSPHPISTGIGFLDHMIDQLNSHAQIGVSVTVRKEGEAEATLDAFSAGQVNRYGSEDQSDLVGTVGAALGRELKKIVPSKNGNVTSRFCCPLDEALVECILTKHASSADGKGADPEGELIQFSLAPYGKYPANKGRSKIGCLQTCCVETFFANLAQHSGLHISLSKIRGDNGHHVIESAFKAFSRALRNLIDGTDTNNTSSADFQTMWGESSASHSAGLQLAREGKLERCTKETSILVHACFDGLPNGPDSVHVDTGIKTLDKFVSILAREACISMEVKCKGDLYVDDHHTSEDVAIALGQVMNNALGTKAGLNRMWCAIGTFGGKTISIFFFFTTIDSLL